jgi:ATP phosphoribosyltransferase regulatory subunit
MAAQRRRLQDIILDIFLHWGFQEIVTPTFEYMDALTLGLGTAYRDQLFKLEERHTGRMLSLRPDITTQIAKLAATRLADQPRPLRFCYAANVFRYNESQTRNLQELYQAGVELIGLESPEADAEMIAIAVECMQAVELTDFRLVVSQPEFFRCVLAEANFAPEASAEIQKALQKKDTSTLETALAQCETTDAHREVLLQLPSLFGYADVLDTAAQLVRNQGAEAALANLVQVYDMLKTYGLEDRVLIDLSELRGFDYYTGITFECFTPNLGYRVCSGGRYDHLLGRYGPTDPATGFAIDLEALLEALEHTDALPIRTAADCLLMDFRQDKREALRVSRELRQRGHRVARDIIPRDREGSLAYARQTGIPYAILMGLGTLPTDQAILHDVAQGTDTNLALADIVDYVSNLLTGTCA